MASIAFEKGDLIIRGGYKNIDIASDSGTIASIADGGTPTVTFTHFFTDNLGVELIAGLPIHHSISKKRLEPV